MLKLGDVLILKKDIKYRNRVTRKGEKVVVGSSIQDKRSDLYYLFWIAGKPYDGGSNTYYFRLHSSWIKRWVETKEQRRKRIIKEIINEDN